MDKSRTIAVARGQFQISPFHEQYSNANTVVGIYANRSFPINWDEDTVVGYRALRVKSALFDVPERPVEISGPDALKLLEKVLARPISTLKTGKARYAIACNADGGILMDGVLMRLADNRFWYVKADGEFDTWLKAHALGLNVMISDPNSWVLQIQGPTSLGVMNVATDGKLSEEFGYFNVGWFDIGGQRLLVSRTGWTGELGYEIYTQGDATDAPALWNFLLKVGVPHGLRASALDAMNIRRIEAGIRNNTTDMDQTMTPFAAGLGSLVDLGKPDFIGREALLNARRDCLLLGFKTVEGETPGDLDLAELGDAELFQGTDAVGRITTMAKSPYLKCLVGFVRLYNADDWPGQVAALQIPNGEICEVSICELPFYDADKQIPRTFNASGPDF